VSCTTATVILHYIEQEKSNNHICQNNYIQSSMQWALIEFFKKTTVILYCTVVTFCTEYNTNILFGWLPTWQKKENDKLPSVESSGQNRSVSLARMPRFVLR
jgi:hypothetical protein